MDEQNTKVPNEYDPYNDHGYIAPGHVSFPPAGRPSSDHHRPDERKLRNWTVIIAPLALHFITILGLAFFILLYVRDELFYISNRRPEVTQADGSTTRAPQRPLQTDIVTTISSGIAVSKVFSTAWVGATAWRCVFILLEKQGLTLHEADRMIRWKLPSFFGRRSSSVHHVGRKSAAGLLVSIILIASLPSQLSGPVLSGSVGWEASHGTFASTVPLRVPVAQDGGSWRLYRNLTRLTRLYTLANQYSVFAYQNNSETNILKRNGPTQLKVNSRVRGITIPYFSIQSFEWLRDPATQLGEGHKRLLENIPVVENTFLAFGPIVTFLPDSWSIPENDPSRPFPEPSIVQERRLVAGQPLVTRPGNPCNPGIFPNFTSEIGYYVHVTSDVPPVQYCYILAWVTFRAGVADCTSCRVSFPGVFQSDNDLTVKPDPLSREVIDTMRWTTFRMINLGLSTPRAHQDNLAGFVSELLLRSYVSTWSAFSNIMGSAEPAQLDGVELAIEGLRARLSLIRVAVWLGLNLMVTVSGLVFIVLQRGCQQSIVAEPALAALLLDTEDLQHAQERALCSFSHLEKDDDVGTLRLCQDRAGHRKVELSR
jgi:hypothetical protein